MSLRKLTKRKYLGEGYIHFFSEDVTGNVVFVPCTQEEYKALGQLNPVNPTMEGHTWLYSAGGTVKVDTPSTLLGEDEYCIDEKSANVFAVLKDLPEDKQFQKLKKKDIVNDNLDVSKIWQ